MALNNTKPATVGLSTPPSSPAKTCRARAEVDHFVDANKMVGDEVSGYLADRWDTSFCLSRMDLEVACNPSNQFCLHTSRISATFLVLVFSNRWVSQSKYSPHRRSSSIDAFVYQLVFDVCFPCGEFGEMLLRPFAAKPQFHAQPRITGIGGNGQHRPACLGHQFRVIASSFSSAELRGF